MCQWPLQEKEPNLSLRTKFLLEQPMIQFETTIGGCIPKDRLGVVWEDTGLVCGRLRNCFIVNWVSLFEQRSSGQRAFYSTRTSRWTQVLRIFISSITRYVALYSPSEGLQGIKPHSPILKPCKVHPLKPHSERPSPIKPYASPILKSPRLKSPKKSWGLYGVYCWNSFSFFAEHLWLSVPESIGILETITGRRFLTSCPLLRAWIIWIIPNWIIRN